MKKKLICLISFLILIILSSKAEYTQTCKLKYKKEDGEWSDYCKADVHFLSGFELNTKTYSYSYSSYNVYAVIYWSQDKVTTIKISGYVGNGSDINKDFITNKFSNLEGSDKDNMAWEICIKNNCF